MICSVIVGLDPTMTDSRNLRLSRNKFQIERTNEKLMKEVVNREKASRLLDSGSEAGMT